MRVVYKRGSLRLWWRRWKCAHFHGGHQWELPVLSVRDEELTRIALLSTRCNGYCGQLMYVARAITDEERLHVSSRFDVKAFVEDDQGDGHQDASEGGRMTCHPPNANAALVVTA